MKTKAPTIVPDGKLGWWGGPDTRPRCDHDGKVILDNEEIARGKAQRAQARGANLKAYLGKCGHWHLGHPKHPQKNQPITTP